MPSFDTVCKPDAVELRNAVDQTNKEIGTRFDFKGSDANVELKDKAITLLADSEFQRTQVIDILVNKMAKRNVDVRYLEYGDIEKMSHDKVKQLISVRHGISQEIAKKIVAAVKASKIKVQASIQGDTVRVQGAKRDDLQSTMALLRKEIADVPLAFENFRD